VTRQEKLMARCSICYTLMTQGDPTADCPDCLQHYHRGCWKEIGGCATYGCARAAVAQKPPPPVLVGAGWGDTKACPACHRQISSSLLVCGCSARFPWADPMSRADYDAWCAEEAGRATARKVLIAGFLLSLAGVTAPLAGPLSGLYAWRKRRQLAGSGGTYLAIGYGSAALGVGYGLLIALTAAGL
jgi:Prokaryotic RING finger family 1